MLPFMIVAVDVHQMMKLVMTLVLVLVVALQVPVYMLLTLQKLKYWIGYLNA